MEWNFHMGITLLMSCTQVASDCVVTILQLCKLMNLTSCIHKLLFSFTSSSRLRHGISRYSNVWRRVSLARPFRKGCLESSISILIFQLIKGVPSLRSLGSRCRWIAHYCMDFAHFLGACFRDQCLFIIFVFVGF